jgi:GNAT superfamily N-acetyltransferase
MTAPMTDSKFILPESIVLSEVPLDELLPDRLHHWRDLPSQEYYLELQAQRGRSYRISLESECVGYLIVNNDCVLVEIHVERQSDAVGLEIAASVVQELGIHRIWCLSFDAGTMELCTQLCKEAIAIGISCRVYQRQPRLPHKFEVRPAEPSDLPAILGINEPDILESPEEASDYILRGGLMLFELGTDLLGFGVMTPIMDSRPEVDIGMLVAPGFRGKGYGAAFIQHLAEHVLTHGLVPVCGCDIDNHASRRSLEKAGFITEHRLLEFKIQETS